MSMWTATDPLMFNPDQELPRVEDTGRRDKPADRALVRDVPLLLDTIDELSSRIQAMDPGGLRTDSEGESW